MHIIFLWTECNV
jgi:hypothetical protein